MLDLAKSLPAHLLTAALVVVAVAYLLEKLAAVVQKIRNGHGNNGHGGAASASGAPPATQAQGFLVLGERIEGLKTHFDGRFDDMCSRLERVETATGTNTADIARLEGARGMRKG